MKNIQNKKNKVRLDAYLVENGWFDTKSQAQAAVMGGKVKVNEEVITKAGTPVNLIKKLTLKLKACPMSAEGLLSLRKL